MGYKTVLTTLLLLILGTTITSAQHRHGRPNHHHKGIITGKLSFTDGEPVAFATLYIADLQKSALSNEDGEFELVHLPNGTFTIEIQSIETVPAKVEATVQRGGTRLDITLERSIVKIDEVVVVGKSEANQLKEKGFSVSILDMAKLNLQSIQAEDLLDRTAGVRIRQSGGMGSETNYNINGLSGSSVRIFIDGIPLRNYGSSFSLSSIPPSQIERVEVYKGVVPAHLSEDALGGAINVVLKKTKGSQNRLSTSYSYGSFNTHRGNVDGSYRNEKTGFTVDGSVFYNYTDNNYKVWGDQVYVSGPSTGWQLDYVKAKRFHDSYESYGLNTNIGFTNVKWADRFTVGLLYSDMNKDVQHGGTMEVVFGNRRTGQSTKMANLKYDKQDLLTKGLDVNAFVSYSHNDRWVNDTVPYIYNWLGERIWDEANQDYYKWNNGGGEQGAATLAKNKERTLAGRANVAYQMHPRHRISVNYLFNSFIRDVEDELLPQAEQELTETRYLTKQIIGGTYDNNFFGQRLKSSIFAKHYMQHVELKDPVKSGNQVSFIEYDKTIAHTGYGATIAFALTPTILLQGSYERALRLPESNELLGNTSESINATYDLEPEKSHNFNLGFILGTFQWGKHELRGDINFFIRNISDMIMRGTENSTTGTYGYENLGKVISKGFDAELSYNYNNRLFLTQNVSWFDARFNLQYDATGKEYAYFRDRLRNAPYFTMNTQGEYIFNNLFQKGSRTSLSYNMGYVHEFFRNWESIGGAGKAVIPTQIVHDIAVSYTFPKNKLTLSLNGRNLTDEQVFDNWALQKPGRAFYGKVSYRIF
ncbi:MAG: TonB-dependent receptor domain-containing protein [Phocaeicola sp.]